MFYKGKLFLIVAAVFIFSSSSFAGSNDPLRKEIYSKLKCCACKDSFENCVCPEAKEMKAYIEAFLEDGVTKDDIYYRVAKKFTPNSILDEEIKKTVEKRLISEAGDRKPQLILESSSIRLGNVKKKEGIVNKAVKISNRGNQDLIINNIRTSCDCVSASLAIKGEKSPDFGTKSFPSSWSAVISPNEEAILNIKVDLNNRSILEGRLFREIYISSNDPVYAQSILKIEANVEP